MNDMNSNKASDTEILTFPNNIDFPNKFVLNKKDLFSEKQNYNQFKEEQNINYKLVYFLTILPVVILFTGLFLSNVLFGIINGSTINKFIFFITNSFFIGLVLHNIQNIIHAGIHFNLHIDKNVNDNICNLLGLFTATEINQVRKIHMVHHTKNGTMDDTEYSYIYPLNLKKILSYFSGLEILKYLLSIDKKINENNNIKISNVEKLKYIFNSQRFFSLILHLTVISFLIFYVKNLYLVLAWVYGFIAFLPFFNSLQNILEHAEEKKFKNIENYKIKPVNRNFGSGFISKYIFGNFGSNKHAIHHWDPSVHFLNLEKTENFLQKTFIRNIIIEKKSTYLDTLKKVLFN